MLGVSNTVSLSDYKVSLDNGFLPDALPLKRLSSPYYRPWEDIVHDLPSLIQSGHVRDRIRQLPVLSATDEHLPDEREWQRAYVVLSYLMHAWIWGGEQPEQRLLPAIARPFLDVSERLELPPCATYAALNLWNYTSTSEDLTNPDNLDVLASFTGTDDERWFFVVSVAIEAEGAKAIPLVFSAIEAVRRNDDARVALLLQEMVHCLAKVIAILDRMHERLDPQVFYHRLRPLLAGSKNMAAAGLPNGVFYDSVDERSGWRQYSGGSNAQSSLIQLFDIALGIEHLATGEIGPKARAHGAFMSEMRKYMPGPHRRFLEYIGSIANIRNFAMSLPVSSSVRQAYNSLVLKLGALRDAHIRIVSRYIIAPARQRPPEGSSRKVNLATASMQPQSSENGAPTAEKRVFYGTGGTTLMPFLKETRDETKAAARFVD